MYRDLNARAQNKFYFVDLLQQMKIEIGTTFTQHSRNQRFRRCK